MKEFHAVVYCYFCDSSFFYFVLLAERFLCITGMDLIIFDEFPIK